MKYTKEQQQQIVDLYKYKNTVEIAEMFNTYNTTIRRILIRNNVILKDTKLLKSNCKNINAFEDISKEIDSYFLGLLVTDGCISKGNISLCLKESDSYILNIFGEYLDKVNISKYLNKKYNTIEYSLKFKNYIIENRLKSYANFDNKSFDLYLKIPLNWNIMRGIFDGDGCFIDKSSTRFQIASCSKTFINQISAFLSENNIDNKITQDSKNRKNTIYFINIYKKQILVDLYYKLYENGNFFLKRKKEKFGSFVEKFTNENALNLGNKPLESQAKP